jgi:Regulator of ribonuclease activity B
MDNAPHMRPAKQEIKPRAAQCWLLAAAVWLFSLPLAGAAPTPPGPEPTRAELRHWFGELRAGGAIEPGAPLDWDYSFSAEDGRKLEVLAQTLVAAGYRIVTLQSTPTGLSLLRVAKVELHTPTTLERRSAELRALARAAQGGVSYAGVSVGPAAGTR